jgi:hypothetical protein
VKITFKNLVVILLLSISRNLAAPAKPREPVPQPAIPAILAAFDKYEVVGMSEAHRMKDEDDFILTLIRTPAFSQKVNDIVVECGNSLYQPTLDRYIAGENVPFADVEKVWRNTTQPMCDASELFQDFYPLVRAINQKLPQEKRLRVLAGDPPIDWDQVKSQKDFNASDTYDRNQSIAKVMEREVLSKHRRALMLFGIFHLMHESATNAVGVYEKNYPNSTFVIGGLEGLENLDSPFLSSSPFSNWLSPSLALPKGTWLGTLPLSHFFGPGIKTDKSCVATYFYPEGKPIEKLVDALLYLGPPSLALREQTPAEIASDPDLTAELNRRATLIGGYWTDVIDMGQSSVKHADNPLLDFAKPPSAADLKSAEADCRQAMQQAGKPPDGKKP